MSLQKLIKISRRVFLKKARNMFAGVAAFGLSKDTIIENFFVNRIPPGDKAGIKSYRALGNTGFKVSDISLGGGGDSAVVRYAVDKGINYIDTAPAYGPSEINIGKALKEKRKDVFITTKLSSWEWRGKKGDELKRNMMNSIETSLSNLRTDYLDCLNIHGGNVERMKLGEVHEVFEKAKKEGKVRFFGVSNHSADIGDIVKQSINDDLFNNLTLAYNYLSAKEVSDYIDEAAKKGKSIVAMKALLGAYLAKVPGWEKQLSFTENFDSLSLDQKMGMMIRHGMSGDIKKYISSEFVISAQKWVLSNPNVNTLLTTFRNFQDVDNYLQASGQKFGWKDKEILDTQVAFIWDKYCRIGCDLCHSSCPKGVPVNDILRFQMYYENYGDKRMAVDGYSGLPKDKTGSNCLDCDAPCQKSCPYGLAVKERLMNTHGTLSRYC